MGTSLILEKLFSRSSFYDIACFSIFPVQHVYDTIFPQVLPIIWRFNSDHCGFLLDDP